MRGKRRSAWVAREQQRMLFSAPIVRRRHIGIAMSPERLSRRQIHDVGIEEAAHECSVEGVGFCLTGGSKFRYDCIIGTQKGRL